MEVYDAVVVGGRIAGLQARPILKAGASVLLLEKNESVAAP